MHIDFTTILPNMWVGNYYTDIIGHIVYKLNLCNTVFSLIYLQVLEGHQFFNLSTVA